MPWGPDDSLRFTKKATTNRLKKLWSNTANSVLQETGDEGRAVKAANSAVKAASGKSK